jgi:hypothetical protein
MIRLALWMRERHEFSWRTIGYLLDRDPTALKRACRRV